MDREELFDKVSDFIRELIMLRDVEIKKDDNLYSDLGFDSMGAVEFVVKVEDEYQIALSDDELSQLRTVNDVIDLILAKISEEV